MTSLRPVSGHDAHVRSSSPVKLDEHASFETHLRRDHPPAKQHAPECVPAQEAGEADLSSKSDIARRYEVLAPVALRSSVTELDARIYPQSLRVTGYLSILASKETPAISPDVEVMLPFRGPAADPRARGGDQPLPIPASFLHADDKLRATVPISTDESGVAQEQGDVARETDASTAVPGLFPEWAKRLARFEGGTATLWIRDFHLDPTQRQMAAEQLREYARGRGWTVDRVMVNGQEIWHAPQTKNQQRKELHGG
jgi:hypothetical protein